MLAILKLFNLVSVIKGLLQVNLLYRDATKYVSCINTIYLGINTTIGTVGIDLYPFLGIKVLLIGTLVSIVVPSSLREIRFTVHYRGN